MRKPDTPTKKRGGSLSPAPQSDPQPKQKSSIEKRERALDDALDDTFPGSDPISFTPKVSDKTKSS
ncbi:hypothetical protein KVP09_03445 [Alcaligenaceae bacterium CGII-47]|nr:hypothetical protein [Alcaligenaceae bacterium CGII-47]